MLSMEISDKIYTIKVEIYGFFEMEIMCESLNEYLSSAESINLMSKLENRYGFASEIEESVGDTVKDENIRRYLWVGTQKISLSGYKMLRLLADTITTAIAEEIEMVNREFSYYRELMPDYLGWRCREEQLSTFLEILSAVSKDRFCDEAFAEILKHAGFTVGKADYCGHRDTYYVENRNGKRIWFDDITIKNEDNPVKCHRPRIEVLHSLVDVKFQKTI